MVCILSASCGLELKSTLVNIRIRPWLHLNVNRVNTSYHMLQATFVHFSIQPRPQSFHNLHKHVPQHNHKEYDHSLAAVSGY